MSGKSQRAAELVQKATTPTIQVHFQDLYAMLLAVPRLPSGRYPEREDADTFVLPLVEHTRRTIIGTARRSDIDVIASTSDGDHQRRQELLALLGAGAREEVLDPGIDVITERLKVDGLLSENCRQARDRWYTRL